MSVNSGRVLWRERNMSIEVEQTSNPTREIKVLRITDSILRYRADTKPIGKNGENAAATKHGSESRASGFLIFA